MGWKEIKQKSPELIQRQKKARDHLLNLDYLRMVNRLPVDDNDNDQADNLGIQLKQVRQLTGIVANVLLSVVGVVTACLYYRRQISDDDTVVALVALFAGLLVATAESSLYIIHSSPPDIVSINDHNADVVDTDVKRKMH